MRYLLSAVEGCTEKAFCLPVWRDVFTKVVLLFSLLPSFVVLQSVPLAEPLTGSIK